MKHQTNLKLILVLSNMGRNVLIERFILLEEKPNEKQLNNLISTTNI